jgi:hypothetical protein
MPYRQLANLLDDNLDIARREHVHLEGDVYEYLLGRQKAMRG